MSQPTEQSGRRLALIVATSVYEDAALSQLRAPAQDASDLAEVLSDPRIGEFEVSQVIDSTKRDIEIAIDDFLSNRDPDDSLLLYLSCHGLLDADSTLYFATRDTIKDKLAATALDAPKLKRQLEKSQARQQLIVLDCCFSGAFLRSKAGPNRQARPVELNRLQSEGRGQAILTASRATEYSLEGDPIDESTMVKSVFTSTLVTGLRTGAADLDNDGLISASDAYRYTYKQLKAANALQTPLYGTPQTEGVIYFGRSVAGIRDLTAIAVAAPGTPAPDRPGSQTPRILMDGPAADFARMRRSSSLIYAETLRQAALNGSVEEAVAITAAGRAVGREEKVDELLAMAARFRPAEDVVQLIAAVREAGHPSDAEQLLAAAGSGRPAAELASLAVVIGQSGEAADIAALLAFAGKARSAPEILDIAFELREVGRSDDADHLLAATAGSRTEKEAAETIVLARRNGTDDDAVAILVAFRKRSIADVARLVGALRDNRDVDMAMFALSLVEDLEPERIAALATELRRNQEGDEDADHVLRWPALRSAPAYVAKLLSLLAEAKRTADVAVVGQAAGRSRPAGDLASIAFNLQPAVANGVLEQAALRPPRVVCELLGLLEPPPEKARMTAEETAARKVYLDRRHRLAYHVMNRSPLDAMTIFDLAPTSVQPVLIQAGATTPPEQILRLMQALSSRGKMEEFFKVAAAGTPHAVARFARALAGSAYVDLEPKLVSLVLGRPPSDLIDFAVELTAAGDRARAEEVVWLAEKKLPGRVAPAYAEKVPSSGVAASLREAQEKRQQEAEAAKLAEQSRIAAEARAERRRLRWRWSGASAVIAGAGGASLALGAGLSRLLVKPQLNIGDWFALVPTTLVAVVLLAILCFLALAGVNLLDDDPAPRALAIAAAIGLVAGFVLGFFAPPIAELGVTVRIWLAWNF